MSKRMTIERTRTMTIEQYIAWLREHDACDEAIEWCETRADFATGYRDCTNPDWLLWLLEHVGLLDDKRARLFACRCVRYTPLADGRVVWDLLTDERSRAVVEVAERYAVGEATDGELAAARDAARYAAWYAGDAAGDAAWDAAWIAAGIAQCARIREVWPVAEVAAAIAKALA